MCLCLNLRGDELRIHRTDKMALRISLSILVVTLLLVGSSACFVEGIYDVSLSPSHPLNIYIYMYVRCISVLVDANTHTHSAHIYNPHASVTENRSLLENITQELALILCAWMLTLVILLLQHKNL